MKIAEPGQPQLDSPKGEDNFLVRGWFWLGILGVLLVFGPSLWHYFTGEDFVFIAAAQGKAFYEPTQRLFYRPLPNLFWQADYALWGLWAGGYHLTNLLLHLVNIVLVGLLARKLTGRREFGGLAAIFFALHPAHIEAVSWLASRPDLIVTAFCLLSALTSLKFFDNFTNFRNLLWLYLLSLLTFAAGLFSKEAAASWPLALFAII